MKSKVTVTTDEEPEPSSEIDEAILMENELPSTHIESHDLVDPESTSLNDIDHLSRLTSPTHVHESISYLEFSADAEEELCFCSLEEG